MPYDKALELIENLAEKRLCKGAYARGDGLYCAIGAVAPSTRTLPSCRTYHKIASLIVPGEYPRELDEYVAREIKQLGMTVDEATLLQNESDRYLGSDEERHDHVVVWLRDRVQESKVRRDG